MTRCVTLTAIVMLAAAAVSGGRQRADAATPNIIFMLADDLGIGDLGYTGQNARAAAGLPAISTPNIDTLAAQSVSFANMYANDVCSASRATLLTGFNQAHVRAKEATFNMPLRKEEVTWGEVLKSAGYSTAMYGKWHVGGVSTVITDFDALPTQQGFDTVFGALGGGYRTQKVWEQDGMGSIRQINSAPDPAWNGSGGHFQFNDDAYADRVTQLISGSASQSQPFAAYVAFGAPHDPYNQLPINPLYANTGWGDSLKQYASLVTRLDYNVGRILQAIDDPNGDGNTSDSIANNTLVIFSSDNGPRWPTTNSAVDTYDTEFFNSNSIYADHKGSTRDGGIRVPFLVRWKGVTTPGTVRTDFVAGFEDILPTFAEMVGQGTPLGIDGRSILPAITGGGQFPRNDVMSWFYPADISVYKTNGWGVRVGDWKLNYRLSTGYSVYNLVTDPGESNNLAATRTDIKTALQQVAFIQGLGRSPFEPAPPPNETVLVQVIDYFTQLKTWNPANGSTDFTAAANWSGGTPTAGIQFPTTRPAQFWDTGPADNWLATVANTTGGSKTALVGADAKVLAMEVRAEQGTMSVALGSGVNLEAFNGVRISAGGSLKLNGGSVKTSHALEIRAGGSLIGTGVVTGWQQLVANIPEFQGKNFFAPDVVNSGVLEIQNGVSAGLVTVDGAYQQSNSGELRVGIFGGGGLAGVDFDKLIVTGAAALSGAVNVDLIGAFVPTIGQAFAILSAGSLTAANLVLSGPDALLFQMTAGAANLQLSFVSGDFDGNGFVTVQDLPRWQSGWGSAGGAAQGDADGNGLVDGDDYLIWQSQLGLAIGFGGATVTPEPGGVVIALVALACGAMAPACRRVRQNDRRNQARAAISSS